MQDILAQFLGGKAKNWIRGTRVRRANTTCALSSITKIRICCLESLVEKLGKKTKDRVFYLALIEALVPVVSTARLDSFEPGFEAALANSAFFEEPASRIKRLSLLSIFRKSSQYSRYK